MSKTLTMVEVDAEDLISFINFADNECLYSEKTWTIREYLWKKAANAIAETRSKDYVKE